MIKRSSVNVIAGVASVVSGRANVALEDVNVSSRSKLFSKALAVVIDSAKRLRTLIGGLEAMGKIGRISEGWTAAVVRRMQLWGTITRFQVYLRECPILREGEARPRLPSSDCNYNDRYEVHFERCPRKISSGRSLRQDNSDDQAIRCHR